jgi:lysophospholipase L1-like esterase
MVHSVIKRLWGVPAAALAVVLFIAPVAASAQSISGQDMTYTPPDATHTNGAYVALGDSVAAGVGLQPLASPTAEDTACARTAQAYPQLVAASLGTTVQNLACSGATAGDLYSSQQTGTSTLAAQIDAAFANGTPKVITVTVGANDLNWAALVHRCYITSCGGSADNAIVKAERGYLRGELAWALGDIYQKSNFQPPKVIFTGYFAPFGMQTCADTQGLDAGEMAWLNQQETLLNQAIVSVTQWAGFARFVPISFAGHELCSANPWIQGLQAAYAFHPTAAGQQAIAAAVKPYMQ